MQYSSLFCLALYKWPTEPQKNTLGLGKFSWSWMDFQGTEGQEETCTKSGHKSNRFPHLAKQKMYYNRQNFMFL